MKRSIQRVAIAALVALLYACVTAPQKPAAPLHTDAKSGVSVKAFATLAPLGSFEWQAAPSYTKLAVLRNRAETRLLAKRIELETAELVQTQADVVRVLLDGAVASDARGDNLGALVSLSSAVSKLNDIEVALEKGTFK